MSKINEKYAEDEVFRTSLRITAGRRTALKEMTKELGLPNQDDMIAYLIDYALELKSDESFSKGVIAYGKKIRTLRMSEKQKISEKMKKLASLPQGDLDRLLAQIEE